MSAALMEVPNGWVQLTPEIDARAGDKFWSPQLQAWIPILVNEVRDGRIAGIRPTFVIRKA